MKIMKKIKSFIRKKIKNEFFADEIIEIVFEKLKEEYGERQITFGVNPAYSLIGDDSDYHRTRRGYMRYKSVIICKIEENLKFLVGKGEAWGSYPADPYSMDIFAIPLSKGVVKGEIKKEIEYGNRFFRSSILASKSSGTLFAGKYWIEKIQIKNDKIREFVQKDMDVDSNFVMVQMGGMTPVVRFIPRFRKELVDYLFNKIIKALSL